MTNNTQSSDLRERLKTIKELIAVFKFERVIYTIVTIIAFFVLIGSAVFMFAKDKAGPAELLLLFGSSGAIGLIGSRLLKMWSDALKFLIPHLEQIENE